MSRRSTQKNMDLEKFTKSQENDFREAVKKGKKFAKYIREKFGDKNYPFHQLLSKAHEIRRKHKLSDAEFAMFKSTYEKDLVGGKEVDRVPQTLIAKLLGDVTNTHGFARGGLDERDGKHLQEILKLHSVSKPLHSSIVLQAIQYRDLDLQALTGSYQRDRGQLSQQHVHPVIAALFLPKIKKLDDHFLLSNMAGLVASRYNRQKLSVYHDYELLFNLISDPNDVVCSTNSAVQDILLRSNLQNSLWNCVLHLRNGQYYGPHVRDFISAIDQCRLNRHDQPDLVYGRHDGVIIKRLFAAFSFRPTVVATYPVVNSFSQNPYHMSIKPKVTMIPMINLRLGPLGSTQNVNLNAARNQQQLFFENGMIVPRMTEIIYSREVLVFYVDRSTTLMRLNPMYHLNLTSTPVAVAGFERVTTRPVTAPNDIVIRNDVYKLRSVICHTVNSNFQTNENIVVGSTAMVVRPMDIPNRLQNEYYLYDPLGVTQGVVRGNNYTTNSPVTMLNGTSQVGFPGDSFEERARTTGVVFIYQNMNDNPNQVIQVA